MIRLAGPNERQALEDLQRRASLALPDYREQLLAHPDAIHLPQDQIDRGEVWVAETHGAIAGFAAVIETESELNLDGLFVEPARWRQGIGSSLVDAAVHQARRRGMALTVIANPAAREFYEKCGFTMEGEAPTRFGPAIRMSR